MATSNFREDGTAQLDKLETMLNEVLKQTGRFFHEAAKGNNAAATAHGMRLKHILPGATAGFHEALDELENDISHARAVLQRDYAVFLSQQDNKTATEQPTQTAPLRGGGDDYEMRDAPSSDEQKVTGHESTLSGAQHDQPAAKTPAEENDVKPDTSDSKASTNLQINTSASPTTSQPPEATTGAASVMDFDSLFNDPVSNSASGSGTAAASPTKADQDQNSLDPANTDTNQEPDFSFASFNEQNTTTSQIKPQDEDQDDIDSFLPGLESYANEADATNDTAMPDFEMNTDSNAPATANTNTDATTNANANANTNANADANANTDTNVSSGAGVSNGNTDTDLTGQGANGDGGEQRDTTFDDLMDFGDFDLGALGAGDGGYEDDGSRFDESFFDLE